ncbi:DUF6249 domain-containing protein [Leyella stercorea]|uniref:DUF6249 domain-containing protein n=1 Tax=Leyella stercorea TaxID=363265 RepID=UPI002430BD39|nr:DUF6249 domain-containing protein [Leyella stercorea]
METLEDILVSLGVVVALPVLIVAIIFRSVMAADRNRKEIILAALEKNPNLNVEDLVKRMNKSEKLIKEKLLAKLQRGCLCCLMGVALVLLYFFPSVQNEFLIIAGTALIAIGIAFLVGYFVGRRMLAKEMLAEEQSMNKE